MICYKIRNRKTGLYKTATERWRRYATHGKTYETLGQARGAAKSHMTRIKKNAAYYREPRPVKFDLELVEFEMIEKKVHEVFE